MKVAVTGATGHLGCNVVRELCRRGHRVRALAIDGSERLDGLDVEFVQGSVLDPDLLERAFEGVEHVYHLAAVISISGDPDGRVRAVNVDGVRNAADVALACGVRRFVHVSSIHAFELEGQGPIEETSARAGEDRGAYDRSKLAGERELRGAIDRGLDAVIVNPTGFIGPGDFGPSFIGQALLGMYRRQLPALVAGGFDWVDVRDVAAGLIAAAERGRAGENYILSGHWCSVREIARIAAGVTGVPAPRMTTPLWLARLTAPLMPWLHRRLPVPLYTAESLRALALDREISNAKARDELGFTARPTGESIADAYTWFGDHGYLGQKR